MITMTINLWEKHPELLEYYRNRYRYVLVDEFQVRPRLPALDSCQLALIDEALVLQDTNKQQFELVRKLTEKSGRLTVVGDDDQCIYNFQVMLLWTRSMR